MLSCDYNGWNDAPEDEREALDAPEDEREALDAHEAAAEKPSVRPRVHADAGSDVRHRIADL